MNLCFRLASNEDQTGSALVSVKAHAGTLHGEVTNVSFSENGTMLITANLSDLELFET